MLRGGRRRSCGALIAWFGRSSGLELHVTISNEAIAIFVRFWVANTSPLPETAQPATHAKARGRYEEFVEALGNPLTRSRTLADEVSAEISGDADSLA